MTVLLSAAEIRTLRRTWLQDYLDDHSEIGSGATVKVTAAAGATSVQLQGLGSGTIAAGAQLAFQAGGRYDVHTVMADAAITASEATVSLSPALLVAAPSSTAVGRVTERIGLFVQYSREHKTFWTDSQLQEFAVQAEHEFGWKIARANQPDVARYRAIRILANEHLLNSSTYLGFLFSIDPSNGGAAERARLRQQIDSDRAALAPAGFGGFSVPQVR